MIFWLDLLLPDAAKHDIEIMVLVSERGLYSRNPFPLRKRWTDRCLSLARCHQKIDPAVRKRAEELESEGLKAIDALHLACAEAAKSEHLLTCDDRVTRRYNGWIKVQNPVVFILFTRGDKP